MGIILRKWRMEDAPDVARYADNENVARNLRDVFPHPYSLRDAETYLADCIAAGDEGRLCRALEADGRAVGSIGVFVGADVYSKSAELGYWLAEEYWGRGMMTQAVREICAEAFRRFGLARIYAEPFARNTGSRRVLEKAGFVLEGRDAQGRIQARRGAGLLHVRAGSGRCARRRRGFVRPCDSRRVLPPRQNILSVALTLRVVLL